MLKDEGSKKRKNQNRMNEYSRKRERKALLHARERVQSRQRMGKSGFKGFLVRGDKTGEKPPALSSTNGEKILNQKKEEKRGGADSSDLSRKEGNLETRAASKIVKKNGGTPVNHRCPAGRGDYLDRRERGNNGWFTSLFQKEEVEKVIFKWEAKPGQGG